MALISWYTDIRAPYHGLYALMSCVISWYTDISGDTVWYWYDIVDNITKNSARKAEMDMILSKRVWYHRKFMISYIISYYLYMISVAQERQKKYHIWYHIWYHCFFYDIIYDMINDISFKTMISCMISYNLWYHIWYHTWNIFKIIYDFIYDIAYDIGMISWMIS